MVEGGIPIVLCIDCEPDEHLWSLDDPSAWSGFEEMAKGTARVRDELERATCAPVHFSWALRMDPQIGVSYGTTSFLPERYPAFFESIARNGDGSGVHPHAWRWDAKETAWIAGEQDPAWVSTCVATAYESYGQAFGRTPTFHRFGYAFMTTDVMNQVRRAGSAFDLTLEPGNRSTDGHDGGEIPRVPYCPDRADFRGVARHADDGFLAVPLSSHRYVRTRTPTGQRIAHPMRTARNAARRLRSQSVIRRPPHEPLYMWRRWLSPTDFWNFAFAAADELERPYLAFAIRSDPASKERFDAVMGALMGDPRAVRLRFTTLEHVAATMS